MSSDAGLSAWVAAFLCILFAPCCRENVSWNFCSLSSYSLCLILQRNCLLELKQLWKSSYLIEFPYGNILFFLSLIHYDSHTEFFLLGYQLVQWLFWSYQHHSGFMSQLRDWTPVPSNSYGQVSGLDIHCLRFKHLWWRNNYTLSNPLHVTPNPSK